MPRDLPLGNGSLLVAFDSTYQIRDLYFPHFGQENHALGHPFRLGVWVDGTFRRLDDPDGEWTVDMTMDASLVGLFCKPARAGMDRG